MFSKVLNHKLFEIFFEKLLIALVIIMAGYLANHSIEKYKLSETQRMAGVAAFVDACQQIWAKIYDLESATNKQEDFDIRLKLANLANGNSQENLPIELKEYRLLVEKKQIETNELINQKRFVIGEKLTLHFYTYIGLVKDRAEARRSMFTKFNEEAKNAQDTVDAIDKQMASMRFYDSIAREYAISHIPN